MTTYVILLRGVTPAGNNKVPMARLREVLSSAGFGQVRTYIQSGNALVETGLPAPAAEQKIHGLIRDRIGPDLTVIARTGAELQAILDGNPFREGHDISRVFFVLFTVPPPDEKVRELLSRDYHAEKLAFGANFAYMYIPGTYGRGTLSAAFLEKRLGVPATMRNFNTLSKLAAMIGGVN